MSTLPLPLLNRWQPLRLGLRNLFRYDEEEFRFSGGRLLLRGNNGTGKTRVLALTLPFLLDGEISPARVEPDGNRNRRFEWHLLLDRFHDRTGYAWLEFGRLEDGVARYCTIGCGMRAVQGHQGLRARWFFVTRDRVGASISLAGEDRQPLAREALRDALEGKGTIYDTADAYRRAIDGQLFGLGESRYRALVDLLIELRRPQLSRELDEERLSGALSEALPPVGAEVLEVVAESYRALERDRDELAAIESAAAAVAEFNQVQGKAVQVHATQLADQVAAAQTRYELSRDAVRETTEAHAVATRDMSAIQERLAQLIDAIAQAQGEERALEASEAMRSAKQLQLLQEDAKHAREAAARATTEESRAAHELAGRGTACVDAAAVSARRAQDAERSATQACAGMAALGRPLDPAPPPLALAALRDAIDERRRSARQLSEAEAALRRRSDDHAHARQRVLDAEQDRDAAQLQAEAALEALREDAAAMRLAVLAHQRTLVVLTAPVDAAERLDEWLREPIRDDPYRTALAEAALAHARRWATARGALEGERATLAALVARLGEEAARLRAGVDPGPPAPAWRPPQARTARPGAPLWRLCEFREEVTPAERAGIEGALQASGLLDAWLHPDGRLERVAGDVCLHIDAHGPRGAAGSAPPAETLARMLVPSIDPLDAQAQTVQPATVLAILEAIALGSGEAERGERDARDAPWVATDGAWGHAPLHGRWCAEVASHLGAGARAAARGRRLAAIAAEQAEAEAALERLATALAQGDTRNQAAEREASGAPDGAPVRQAAERSRERLSRLAALRGIVAERQLRAAEALQALERAHAERQQLAEDCRLQAWLGRAEELRDAIELSQVAIAELGLAVERLEQAAARHHDAERERAAAEGRAAHCAALASDLRTQAERRGAEAAALEETLGAAVMEVHRRLAQVRGRLGDLEQARTLSERSRGDAQEALGRTAEAARSAQERLQEGARLRSEAMSGLLAVAADGLLAGLGEEYREPLARDATDTRILELARMLRRDAAGLDRDAATADRLQAQVSEAFQRLHARLSASDLLPISEVRHRLMVVHVAFQGADRTSVALAPLLRSDADQRRLLFTAREREVIENFLIDEAAQDLHQHLNHAQDWLARVNDELSRRPMSTGMSLRFQWLPAEDGPEGLAEARERLLRPHHLWSPADREALAAFLQRRIQAAGEALEGGTLQEQLAIALDYRRWHRFVIERRQDARWTRLTRRTHGTGSGGEKAVSLTMPQFAAAAAHYQAAPLAPRLILLDEAFVGIDADMRRKCLGLLAAFDLDVVMTSEREWGCYDTVPALSIYQLAADEASGCVTATRYVWDGHQRTLDAG